MMSAVTGNVRVSVDVTYEKVASSEWDPALRVPFLAVQEIQGILEDGFFHTSIEDDGLEGAFRARGDQAPFVPHVGSID